MKKTRSLICVTALFSMLILQACNSEGSVETANQENTQETAQNEDAEEHDQETDDELMVSDMQPIEPTSKDICIYCEMGIPHGDDAKALFTGQAITHEGERVFFDDSGCIENAEAELHEQYAKVWVKDFNTNEWIEKDNSYVVHNEELETQMSYKYAFFETEADATQYVEESAAELSDWDNIRSDAAARAKDGGMHHGEGHDMDEDHEMNMDEHDDSSTHDHGESVHEEESDEGH